MSDNTPPKDEEDRPPPYNQLEAPVSDTAPLSVTYTGQQTYGTPAHVTDRPSYPGPPPRDYFLLSIVATIFCFCPTGIAAIIKSAEARTSYARQEALVSHENASSARTLLIATVVTGVCLWLTGTIIIIVLVAHSIGEERGDD